MTILIENMNTSLWFCVNILRWSGFHVPKEPTGLKLILLKLYAFCGIMFTVAVFIVVQIGDLIQIWGDVTLMTDTLFLLFTMLAYLAKIVFVMMRRDAVQAMIDECDEELKSEHRPEGKNIMKISNQETTRFQYLYTLFSVTTILGWVLSAEKGKMPFRAWYPYDVSKSPVYELTYIHQSVAIIVMGFVNFAYDVMMTSLTAVTRCRIRLLALSLKTLCHDIPVDIKLLTPEQEKVVKERLNICVLKHQAVLDTAAQLQACFSEVILAQLTVSMGIICVTAYQLAFDIGDNLIRLLSMVAYLFTMIMEVYLFCYQGNHLSEDSAEIADAAYECPWYLFSTPLRRSILILMARSRRVPILTAGGFTTLSLNTFMSIIKASYSFFTVLQQTEH